jgi:hypothetical protein
MMHSRVYTAKAGRVHFLWTFFCLTNIGCMTNEKQSSGKLINKRNARAGWGFRTTAQQARPPMPSYSLPSPREVTARVLCGAYMAVSLAAQRGRRAGAGMPVSKLSWRERASHCVRAAYRFALGLEFEPIRLDSFKVRSTNKLLLSCRIIEQMCILRHTLIINFSQENIRYLT